MITLTEALNQLIPESASDKAAQQVLDLGDRFVGLAEEALVHDGFQAAMGACPTCCPKHARNTMFTMFMLGLQAGVLIERNEIEIAEVSE